MAYKCTSLYVPADDAGVLWNDPDIGIEQELPDELKKRKVKPRGEASLRGHLKNKDVEKEESGSSAYVPREPEKDQQLQLSQKTLIIHCLIWEGYHHTCFLLMV